MKDGDKLDFIFDELHFIEIKNFCFVKDTVKRIKRQATGWEKICAKHISNKGLISRIHKEFFKFNKKKKTQLKNAHIFW